MLLRIRPRGRRLPRVALLLALVLLIPVTGLAALTGLSVISTWRERQAALKVRADIAAPGALMAARALWSMKAWRPSRWPTRRNPGWA